MPPGSNDTWKLRRCQQTPTKKSSTKTISPGGDGSWRLRRCQQTPEKTSATSKYLGEKPMENSSESTKLEDEQVNTSTRLSFVYNRNLWGFLLKALKFRVSTLFAKIPKFYSRLPVMSKRHKVGIPLPSVSSSLVISLEASNLLDALKDIASQILLRLHILEENLQFWQCKGNETNFCKMYFMIFERGPRALIDGIVRLVRGQGSTPMCHIAVAYIDERVAILRNLQRCLATFLALVYVDVNNFERDVIKDPNKALSSLVLSIDNLFTELEASIANSNSMSQGLNSCSPLFDKLHGTNIEGCQWLDSAVNLFYQNFDKLDAYVSLIVAKACKPRTMTTFWIRNTCGVVGLAVCSMWLLQHSRLMGSSDIDNMIHLVQKSMVSSWEGHIKPLLSGGAELFAPFKTRDEGVKMIEDSYNSFHRYEECLMHQIQTLPDQREREIISDVLVQAQSFHLNIKEFQLALEDIFAIMKISLAILGTLPAFFLFRSFVKMMRYDGECSHGIAQLQRKSLVVEVRNKVSLYRLYIHSGEAAGAARTFGLILCSLDRLYRAVERHAIATGEWLSVRRDIIDLASLEVSIEKKLEIISHMEEYECLLRLPKM